MSASQNGSQNANGDVFATKPRSQRFSDIPSTVEIPINIDDDDETVELNLTELGDDPREICQLLEQEQAARTYWMTVALAYAKQRKIDHAIDTLIRGASALQRNDPRERLSIYGCLCWMYLWKSRDAPRIAPEGTLASEAKTKEFYLREANQAINEATKINPVFPPLFLARGVLQLLRASLQTPSKSGEGKIDIEKTSLLESAQKAFDEAIRVSHGKNMLAVMGKSRAQYSLGKYEDALKGYQEVLQKMPDLIDPDPRLGIGCCFWQLGFKQDAKLAWERSLEVNPESKIANILLGLYTLDSCSRIPTNSPEFSLLYKKAMTEYTQKAFKLGKDLPLTCVTFAGFFLSRKSFANVDSLAHRAIQYTDMNAVASDGWYLLARKEHYGGDAEKASNYYRRADDARGGAERGYLPAKFGVAQLSVLRSDLGEAKLLLEKIISQSKTHEAMVLLGTLYAEEVFAAGHTADSKDTSSTEQLKKAISLLETVRNAWKDPTKGLLPDPSVLLNLARLYELGSPDKALQCLLQVEQLEIDQIPEADRPKDIEDPAALKIALRKFLPPQLLNNIGCFYSQADKHDLASGMFQSALNACVAVQERDATVDTDALVTSISFNLGRSYESNGLTDKALEVYESLLARHDDYIDARMRVAYIKLRKFPNKEGPDAVAKLYQEHTSNPEVRALYGWYLSKVHGKKRSANVLEDQEFRHHKHTLQHYDKHDRYALVAMGNLYLMHAREMRRDTEQDRQKRSSTYSKAVEFFDKALTLDGKNAYAAQGIAIALAEDRKDNLEALQIMLKVRDTVKEPHSYVNLGHIFADSKQFAKAIENYETALSKEGRANDVAILACLGRAWLNKGRNDKDLEAFKKSLTYAKRAFEVSPEQVHNKFNVAFVQIQLATNIITTAELRRTLAQLQEASKGLEEAIAALDEIATHPQTPYPKNDLEQRANMARNTLRKQIERAIASQAEFEEKNKEKLQAARDQREAIRLQREAQRLQALQEEERRKEELRKAREIILADDAALAARQAEQDRSRAEAEMTTDSETGEKVKRKKRPARRAEGSGTGSKPKRAPGTSGRKKKKKAADVDGDESDQELDRPTKKKRRLAAKETSSKFKSAEIIIDSDEEEDDNEDYNERDSDEDDELDRAERKLKNRASSRSPSASGDNQQSDDDDDNGSSRHRGTSRSKRTRENARSNRKVSDDYDDGDNDMDVDHDSKAQKSATAEDSADDAAPRRAAAENDEDEDDDVAATARQPNRARRGRVVESDDDEDDEEPAQGAKEADTSMVDAADSE